MEYVTSIRSVKVGSPVQQFWMLVEIIPSEIADVVSKPLDHIAKLGGAINDACGYESLDAAIINAQNVGTSLLGKVKPENLLFVFGESVQSLQSGLREICDRLLVTYPASDCYGPIYSEEDARANKDYREPRAIVLCKIKNAEPLERLVWKKQKQSGDDAKRYEITWRELQNLQRSLGVITHGNAKSPNEKS